MISKIAPQSMMPTMRASRASQAGVPADRLNAVAPDANWNKMQALAAIAAVRPHPPVQCTVSGTANGSDVSLSFDRRQGTADGSIGGNRVSLQTAPDGASISGEANGSAVSLTRQWSEDHIDLSGDANGKPLQMSIDWKSGTLTGSNGDADIDLRFDLQMGTVEGTAAGKSVSLNFNGTLGQLGGEMNGQPVDLSVVNRGLDDVLQNFYLFLPN